MEDPWRIFISTRLRSAQIGTIFFTNLTAKTALAGPKVQAQQLKGGGAASTQGGAACQPAAAADRAQDPPIRSSAEAAGATQREPQGSVATLRLAWPVRSEVARSLQAPMPAPRLLFPGRLVFPIQPSGAKNADHKRQHQADQTGARCDWADRIKIVGQRVHNEPEPGHPQAEDQRDRDHGAMVKLCCGPRHGCESSGQQESGKNPARIRQRIRKSRLPGPDGT